MLTEEERDWIRAKAAEALDAAEGRRLADAAVIVRYVTHRHNWPGLVGVVIAWCEAYTDHVGDGRPVEADPLSRPIMVDVDTGAIGDADGLPREVQWAVEVVLAHLRCDTRAFADLMYELRHATPTGSNQRVHHLIEGIALTVSNTPRGIALMGADEVP